MKVYSFTGKSGTGKTYQAIRVAKEKGIPALIDDGLLIYKNKIIRKNNVDDKVIFFFNDLANDKTKTYIAIPSVKIYFTYVEKLEIDFYFTEPYCS